MVAITMLDSDEGIDKFRPQTIKLTADMAARLSGCSFGGLTASRLVTT